VSTDGTAYGGHQRRAPDIDRAKQGPARNSGIGPDPVLLFRTGDEYLFTAYIDHEAVFDDLQQYYNRTEYRFEVPVDAFETVCERLSDAYFEPVEVTDLGPYCVVIESFEEYAAILKRSVATWTRRGHRFFLMASELAVNDAVERGATRLDETEFVVGL
jgi:hypothetical protein